MSGRIGRTFGRLWWLILVLAVAVGGLSFGGSLLCLRYLPTWRAEARIMITGTGPVDPLDPEPTANREDVQDFINSQVLLIKERSVIRRALMEPILRDTTWFKRNYEEDLSTLEERLLEGIQVRAVPDTHVIEVSFESTSTKDVAPVVNSVVKVYLEWVRELLKQETRSQRATLQNEETKLKSAMRLRKQELGHLSRSVPGLRVGGPVLDTGVVTRDLRQALARAEVDQAVALAEYRDTRSMSLSALARAAAGEDSPLPTTRQRLEPVAQEELKSLLKQVLGARRNVLALSKKLDEEIVRQKELDERIAGFHSAEEEFRNVRSLYAEVSTRRRKLDLILSAPDNLSIDRAGQALPPLEPVWPNVPVSTVFGALLGVALGVVILLLVAAAKKPEIINAVTVDR